MTRRLLLVLALSSICAAGNLTVAGSPAAAVCKTDEFTRVTTCWLTATPVADRSTPIGDGRTSSFVWVSFFWYNAGGNPFELYDNSWCRRTAVDGLTTTYTFGNVYVVQLRNAATGAPVTAPQGVCVFDNSDLPEPPPPPPSPAEFVEAARAVLTVSTWLNPRAEIGGLTGLDTWLWCEDPGQLTVGVALRGWTAQAALDAVEFAWAVGGTDSASFAASSCGSEADPAASWMPETKGPYSVTLTTTWAGTWELAYLGLPAGVFPLGPYDFAAPTVAYPVGEYRGALTPPGNEDR